MVVGALSSPMSGNTSATIQLSQAAVLHFSLFLLAARGRPKTSQLKKKNMILPRFAFMLLVLLLSCHVQAEIRYGVRSRHEVEKRKVENKGERLDVRKSRLAEKGRTLGTGVGLLCPTADTQPPSRSSLSHIFFTQLCFGTETPHP